MGNQKPDAGGSMSPEQQLQHGPAVAAVLRLLEQQPRSGYQLAAALQMDCPQALSLGEAALYAVLYYLEAHRWAAAKKPEDSSGRRVYELTERGRQRLNNERRHWQALARLFAEPAAGSSHE
jgi:DNA-binding PadR family transcriptional regulator